MSPWMQKRIKEPGCENLADVRWKLQRRKAQQICPEAFNLWEVRLLRQLRDGPKTCRQIAEALGLRYDPNGCRVQTALADLRKRQLVTAQRQFGKPLVYRLLVEVH